MTYNPTSTSVRYDRRRFLGGAAAAAAGGALLASTPFGALAANAASGRPPRTAGPGHGGYGALRPVTDTTGRGATLSLPAGFSFAVFGVEREPMADGNRTPKGHDGMAAFGMGPGVTRLVRNHEDRDGPGAAGLDAGPSAPHYDPLGPGGTTTLEVVTDPRDGSFVRLTRDFVSIQGTIVNCAGGPTPWGSWLTCEETTGGETQGWQRDHGYVFEVPAAAEGPVEPVPLRDMGRFVHEAAAIDPATGIVYETEDRGTAGFYRFLPDRPGDLAAGGHLQVLAVRNGPGFDTRTGQQVARALPVVWVDIADPDPPAAETNSLAVFEQGLAGGAAIFDRLEGCWYGNRSIFFASSSGGDVGEGQVWEYRPAGRSGGVLRLVFESPSEQVLDNPDNVTVSPRGGVLLCEDGDSDHLFLRGVTPGGRIFDLAQNQINEREWAGACWSADGRTLFVNVQGDTSGGDNDSGNKGMTFAIWGPWEDGAL